MSERNDLTRWNRAGLTRFRYVEGNAIEYLELLRQQLVEQFADPKTETCKWLNPSEKIPANEAKQESETLIQRLERLSLRKKRILDTYHQDRRDWAWEITRTFARACHILTEYANAYTNEGYLGTATQWDHVRRLVKMLDYHPAPPASASTRLVFVAKENKKGIVRKGFQVKNNPTPTEAKVVFETLTDIEIDAALNELRPKGWDRSDDPVALPPDDNGGDKKRIEQRALPPIADEFAINLKGVGKEWETELNGLKNASDPFRIKDFLDLDPEDSGTNIGVIKLKELKAKATEICEFELEEGWSEIYDRLLPDILAKDIDSLAQLTGKSHEAVVEMQQKVALIRVYLDHPLFTATKLQDLLPDKSTGDENDTAFNDSEEDNTGTNNSEISTAPTNGNNTPTYSTVANWPARYLQGIGSEWAFQLDALKANQLGLLESKNSYKIKNLMDIDPENSGTGINVTRLKELKANATAICEFSLNEDWSTIETWLLPEITNTETDVLAPKTGNLQVEVDALKQKIELIRGLLDQTFFVKSRLQDLLPQHDLARPLSKVSVSPVIHLQGISTEWAWQLNLLLADTHGDLLEENCFKIRDFLQLDPENSGTEISVTKLKEFIAMATAICEFDLEEGWTDITNWLLTRITSESVEFLADFTGNLADDVRSLQHRANLIGSFLDHPQYAKAKLKDLIRPLDQSAAGFEPDSVATQWRATVKPKVKPEQIAMIYRAPENIAEAATVDKVDEKTQAIHLFLDQVGYTWITWPKGETTLHVSPRWKRDCWLNGSDVIRTKSPHGISDGTFIGWKTNGAWEHAEVTETDRKSLRLDYDGILPQQDTKLYQLSPVSGSVLSKDYVVVAIRGPRKGEDLTAPELEVEEVSPKLKDAAASIFTVDIPRPPEPSAYQAGPEDTGPGLLPPAALPKIGSFLFPSPMLPMDLVKIAVELMLSMGVMMIPSTGEFVIKGLPPDTGGDDIVDVNGLYEMLDGLTIPRIIDGELVEENPIKPIVWNSKYDTPDKRKTALKKLLTTPDGKSSTPLFKKIKNDLDKYGPPLVVSESARVLAVVEEGEAEYMFNGEPDKLKKDDWVVGKFDDGLRALKIKTVQPYVDDDQTDTFSLSFNNLIGNEGELQKVYADFRNSIIAEGANENKTVIESKEIVLDGIPDSLKTGSEVLLTAEGKEPVIAKIEDIDVGGNTIKTIPPASGFNKGELKILGNVVLAGHGESKPAKILGSGDASKSNQEFTLEVEYVSFTPDATKSAGVAAAIEVDVAGRVWEQVSTLKDSAPGDHHYTIRMTEEGYVKILFGDGENGRRLPSGKNNIRVRYRVGTGIVGNVPAGSLEKPVNPHPLVETVLQPMQAAGGGDMESITSLRENAPSTLLALERAVSLADFSHLAARQSSVWQAQAYSQNLREGRKEIVKVVIVPAGGVQSDDIEDETERFLQNHALPGVSVSVSNFKTVLIDLIIAIRVKFDEFIAEDVINAVANAVVDHFALQRRRLGQHLYLSEVYKIVEGVRGVENSTCKIFEHSQQSVVSNGKKELQVIEARNQSTVIYLDPKAGSLLTVTAEEYHP